MCFTKKKPQPFVRPEDIPELAAHRFDSGNISLFFESLSLANGHAGTQVMYYAALHKAVRHKYCILGEEKRSTVDMLDVPPELTDRDSIRNYVGQYWWMR